METYGELKKVLTAISKNQKGQKVMSMGKEVAIDTLIGLIPGGSAATTALGFLQAAFKRPDTKKTNTWLDKLDIDDKVSQIVDDTVENSFMEYMVKKIQDKPDQERLGDNFNMNTELQNWLSDTYNKRTVSFMKESIIRGYVRKKIKEMNTKIKKSRLKQIIKEEIQNVLKEYVETLNIETSTGEEGNKQITLSVLGGGWEDNQLTLSTEEAKELQNLAKSFVGSRKEISKSVNTKDKNSTQSIIGIKPEGLKCIIYRKEGMGGSYRYKGYDISDSQSNTGYLKAQQSIIYQMEDLANNK